MGGRRGWDKLSSTEVYILTMCKTDSSWEITVLPWESSRVLCDDLEGWNVGEGGSRGREYIYIDLYLGFPVDSDRKESACFLNAGDPGSTPGSGISPGEGNSYPLQYIYIYSSDWFVLLNSRNQHNIVKQLSHFQKSFLLFNY